MRSGFFEAVEKKGGVWGNGERKRLKKREHKISWGEHKAAKGEERKKKTRPHKVTKKLMSRTRRLTPLGSISRRNNRKEKRM